MHIIHSCLSAYRCLQTYESITRSTAIRTSTNVSSVGSVVKSFHGKYARVSWLNPRSGIRIDRVRLLSDTSPSSITYTVYVFETSS